MKRYFLLFFIVLICSCVQLNKEALTEGQQQELHSYNQNKQFFKLRDALKKYKEDSSVMLNFFRGISCNKFNQLDASIKSLNSFIEERNKKVTDSLLISAYEILGDDYLKTYRYREAADIYRNLLNQFNGILEDDQKSDYENSAKICEKLIDAPPQTVYKSGDSRLIPVDGGYLPVKINGVELKLGPDTGANFSVIIRSLAREAGMQIIDANIDVHNVAGQVVNSDLGIAKELSMGNAHIKNVVFLVFDDEDLYFPEADMQILGVIGFPVFSAFSEITFYPNGEFFIPMETRQMDFNNLCINELTPVIAGYYKGERFAFALDTGAGKTTLYPPFYLAHKEEMETEGQKITERVTGFGGSREISAYKMRQVQITFGNEQVEFEDIPVLTDYTLDDSHHFFGNIGRDSFIPYKSMTINFESMFVVFE
jgi:hypothetical protein